MLIYVLMENLTEHMDFLPLLTAYQLLFIESLLQHSTFRIVDISSAAITIQERITNLQQFSDFWKNVQHDLNTSVIERVVVHVEVLNLGRI